MSAKEFDVSCPCCESRLSVDVRTQRVVRWRAGADLGEKDGRPKVSERDWDQALGKVNERLEAGSDRFDDSLQREKRRADDLDALFDKLKDKKDDEPGADGLSDS